MNAEHSARVQSVGGKPAVFIDKDGTLIHDVPYNANPALLRFMPAAGPSLLALAEAGHALVLVTNQAGLALGRFSGAALQQLLQALRERLMAEAGVALLDVMVCPHAPRADGSPQCACRKPAPGMLLQAAERHGLDLARSWLVGDTLDDIEAAHRAGCRGVLLNSGGETLWEPGPLRTPDALVQDWPGAVQHMLAPAGSAWN